MSKTRSPLANLRRSRTLTQADMARILQINQATYAKYELGRIRPTKDVQALIAAILGGSQQEIFPDKTEATV